MFLFLSEQGAGIANAKYNLYDPGIRSAAIARWPGKIKAGSESDAWPSTWTSFRPSLKPPAANRFRGWMAAAFSRFLLERPTSILITCLPKPLHWGLMASPPLTPYALCDERYKYIWNLNHENAFPCNEGA